MTRAHTLTLAGLILLALTSGCRKRKEEKTIPDPATDFWSLFRQNCSECHGSEGRLGGAQPLNDPPYQYLASKERLRQVISQGVPGTPMTGFSKTAGGSLTEQQIAILVDEMKSRWSRPSEFEGVTAPPYSAEGQPPGDPQRGEAAYKTFCAQCHGPDGGGGTSAGSIIDPKRLAMASDQSLRTTTIVGRADLDIPDWRNYVPGRPMTPQEVSDLVAWQAAHRPKSPGVVSKQRSSNK